MKKIKLGIIGVGKISKFHLDAFSSMENVEITALCNRTISKANELAEVYGVTKVYSDYNKMFQENELDGACIFVTGETMAQVIIGSLKYGVPLLVEKPFGINFEEAKKVKQAYDSKKVKVFVGHNRRFMSTITRAKEIMDENGGIKSIVIEGNERLQLVKQLYAGRDSMVENWLYLNSIHTIDLFRYFCGEPNKVISMSKFGDYHSFLKFDDSIGHYYAVWDAPDGWSVQLLNDKVKVIIKPLEKLTVKFSGNKEEIVELSKIDTDYKPGFYNQNKSFIDFIDSGNKGNLVDIDDAFKTMKLISDIEQEN